MDFVMILVTNYIFHFYQTQNINLLTVDRFIYCNVTAALSLCIETQLKRNILMKEAEENWKLIPGLVFRACNLFDNFSYPVYKVKQISI